MRIRVLGAGWFGCHVASTLIASGHEVEVHESGPHVFCGASGKIPARLHLGAPHYPRSFATQRACQEHLAEFLEVYGKLTRPVPVNLYAVARDQSLIDFETYRRILRNEIEFLSVYNPAEFGLQNVEGAVQVGERHIVVDLARRHFERELAGAIQFNVPIGDVNDARWDMTVDASFCSHDNIRIDRFEPCLVVLLEGPIDRTVTIVDGQFPSLYVWNEDLRLSSLSSAKWTPFSKSCKTYGEARALLDGLGYNDIHARAEAMLDQMAEFFPAARERYRIAECLTSIRAMPLSGSDARLVDIVKTGSRCIRIRSGKIDSVVQAGRRVKEMIGG